MPIPSQLPKLTMFWLHKTLTAATDSDSINGKAKKILEMQGKKKMLQKQGKNPSVLHYIQERNSPPQRQICIAPPHKIMAIQTTTPSNFRSATKQDDSSAFISHHVL